MNVVIGTYRNKDGKQFIELDKKLGSNADAQIVLFILQNVSKNPHVVFLAYCANL